MLSKFWLESFVVAPTYCSQMFTGRVCARPSDELKHKFSNLYTEPIQFDNSEGKQQKEIPYMIINLDYNDEVYIGKNTHIVYIEEESVECNYIEVCKSIETTECHNWMPKRKIVNSDLVYSPAQVTEHWWVELRDQDVPKETRQEFVKLKEDYPEVFSLNNQDIGHTQLVTMHVDTGDSPPICQKPYTLPLKHYSWVQQEIETLEQAGIIKKSLSPWASPIVVVPKKSRPAEPPRQRMCVDFRKINDLQPTSEEGRLSNQWKYFPGPTTQDWWNVCCTSWCKNIHHTGSQERLLSYKSQWGIKSKNCFCDSFWEIWI